MTLSSTGALRLLINNTNSEISISAFGHPLLVHGIALSSAAGRQNGDSGFDLGNCTSIEPTSCYRTVPVVCA